MDSFDSYLLRRLYRRFKRLGDRLAKVERLVDWEAFRPIVAGMYCNDGPQGGRPNVDEVVMVKMLICSSGTASRTPSWGATCKNSYTQK